MCNLKPLKMGNLTAKLPIIQEGWASESVSLPGRGRSEKKAESVSYQRHRLVSRGASFAEDSQAAEVGRGLSGRNLKGKEEISPDGVIGFNIMVATAIMQVC